MLTVYFTEHLCLIRISLHQQFTVNFGSKTFPDNFDCETYCAHFIEFVTVFHGITGKRAMHLSRDSVLPHV